MAANVCLPVEVHAFVLNESVADDNEAKIAPITQPNYTFLRLDDQVIQNDVHDFVDLHYTSPHGNNSRVTDLGSNVTLTNRLGVYVSWVIPRAYRSGTSATNTTGADDRKRQQGFPVPQATDKDYSAPDFRPVPTRWLVVRHIDTGTVTPAVSDTVAKKIQCRAWVIESDRQWNLDSDKEMLGKDLQVDVSPFVAPSRENDRSSVAQQAEVFIGNKTDATIWVEDDTNSKNPPSRIDSLSLLTSSNHLFADYQPHNTNVFSMVDDFTYEDDAGKVMTMQSAKASYYVIGWHRWDTDDPFYMTPQLTTQSVRLDALNMSVQGAGDEGPVDNWLGQELATTCLCHGALYEVQWTADDPPAVVPARVAAQQLTKNTPNIPVAVGATAMDALITYVAAHKDTDTGPVQQLEKDLWNIRMLLLAQEDGSDPLLEAKDVLYNYGFERLDGGNQWNLSGAADGTQPSKEQSPDYLRLGTLQAALDNAKRTVQYLQWQLFSLWWKFVSGAFGDPSDPGTINHVKTDLVLPLVNRIKLLVGSDTQANSLSWLQGQVQALTTKLPVERAASPSFFQQKDPTLMIGGVEAGWAADYLDKLKIRLAFQVASYVDPPDDTWSEFDTPSASTGLLQQIVPKLPSGVQDIATSLLREFRALRPTHTAVLPSPTFYFSLYHDQGPPPTDPNAPPPPATDPWRDCWYGQPWFPLFIEWEAEYFHIPYTDFGPVERQEQDAVSVHPVLRFEIPSTKSLMGNVPDRRTTSGRILLLPQPGFSLKSAIKQLIRNMGAQLDQYLPGTDPNTLLNEVNSLPYLSHPLTGLREHLTTRVPGTHITTTQRPPGEKLGALQAAVDASTPIGMGANEILLQQGQSDLTPYGHSIGLVAYAESQDFPPLKPVTHGQMRFTALNIIDKFGQAICALDPTPAPVSKLPHIAPGLTDLYTCQEISKGVPNVVDAGLAPPYCEFVQLPPGINQGTRINATSVTRDGTGPWRPTEEWENPIWGWIVVNYVEYALQIFLPDGTFYREIVHGGINADTVSPAWAPFQKPNIMPGPSTPQLDYLIQQLSNETYLTAFFDMLNGAFANLPATPDTYAQYMSSIIGKPLALTHTGWSIELATPPLQNESTLNNTPEDRVLLSPTTPVLPVGRDPTLPRPSATTPQYSFPLKIGDGERAYDGLIGYFNVSSQSRSGFDFSQIFTYFPSPKSSSTVLIDSSNFPLLNATYVSPDALVNPGNVNGGTTMKDPAAVVMERNGNLSIFACIVDPFTKIHGYTGVLPIQTLVVPAWAMEAAMKNITAFFKAGPILVTEPLPAWDAGQALKADDPADKIYVDPKTKIPASVAIPAVGKAGWAWLQPYDEPVPEVPEPGFPRAEVRPRVGRGAAGQVEIVPPPYLAVGVGKVDGTPRFEDAPYLAVEGYLRQTGPLMQPGSAKAGP
ncbi:hypothetical protein B0J14DRAFT_611156 [Halenospora varia]|nr:hypothetical protein B0J14DRAFT_611156 [Halenospora varia]